MTTMTTEGVTMSKARDEIEENPDEHVGEYVDGEEDAEL